MIALSDGERRMVKESIILPMVMTVFERDKKVMQASLKTSQPYLTVLDSAMNRVQQDLVTARRFLRKNGIKMYEQQRTDVAINCKYLCRGYHHEDAFMWGYLKTEVQIRMMHYLGEDVPALQKTQ